MARRNPKSETRSRQSTTRSAQPCGDRLKPWEAVRSVRPPAQTEVKFANTTLRDVGVGWILPTNYQNASARISSREYPIDSVKCPCSSICNPLLLCPSARPSDGYIPEPPQTMELTLTHEPLIDLQAGGQAIRNVGVGWFLPTDTVRTPARKKSTSPTGRRGQSLARIDDQDQPSA
jgi:hypothetical protein